MTLLRQDHLRRARPHPPAAMEAILHLLTKTVPIKPQKTNLVNCPPPNPRKGIKLNQICLDLIREVQI